MPHNIQSVKVLLNVTNYLSHDMRQLKKRPMFRKESIDEAIKRGYNYHPEYWESILEDNAMHSPVERFEVLEYWGMIPRDIAEENGMEIPKDFDDRMSSKLTFGFVTIKS
jgi:hypothetical protein